MKVIRNNIIPFPGFAAINLFGIIFARKNAYISERTLNYEAIHTAQMKEMLYIFFYLWYVIEWFIRLFMKGNAYHNISFEREAYTNQYNKTYLEHRKFWVFINYIRKK